jgi:hypothetical protein
LTDIRQLPKKPNDQTKPKRKWWFTKCKLLISKPETNPALDRVKSNCKR